MKKNKENDQLLTWAEVDLKAVKHNLRQIVKLAEKNKFHLSTRPRAKGVIKSIETIMAVIKADAYGHGMERIALLLDKERGWFIWSFRYKRGNCFARYRY